ncbi:beta-alanyl-bioamine nonribosomal peptide synthetase ebony-like [Glandiceps talaboti]
MDTEEESIVYSVMEGEHRPILERLPSHTIHGLFNYMVNLNNHEMNQKPAIIYKDATITFEELNGYTNNLAALLRKMLNIPDKPYSEISRTPIIGVHMHPSEKVVVVLLAVLKMGAAYVPLDPDYPIQRLQHIMKDSQPICILASQGTPLMKKQREDTSKNLNSKGDILCIDDMWTETIDPSWSPENYPEADNDNIRQSPLACILYTSGRTGVPKGVCLSHESILHRLAWQWKTFPFKENDIGCLKTTLNFVDSLSETFGFILQGRPTVPIDKDVTRDPEQLLSVLHAHKVTRITVVPSLLSSILSMVSHNSDSRQILDISQTLKFWVCSGEELPSQLLKDFFTFFPEGTLANFYGSTEVTGDVTYATFKKESSEKIESRVPIGIPMFNTNIYVLDENLQPVPIGDVGSIYVSGRNLAVAYFNDKDETSQGFFKNNLSQSKHHERLYKMGDFGRMVFDQTPKHFNQRLERRLTLIFEGSEHAQR